MPTKAMDHLTEENIRYSETFLKHRELLKRLFLFLFFFADVLLILNLAYRFVVYNDGFLQELEVENNLTANYIPYAQLHKLMAPIPLQVASVTLINTKSGQYDLVAKITNPNEKWMAETVSMVANIDGVVTEPYEVFVLPNLEQYAFWFGVESQTPNPAARIEILATDWKRVRDRQPLELLKQISFSPPQFKNLASGFQIEAQLKNNSASSFWYMGVNVIVMRQGEVVGVNTAYLERVKAGSTRSFNVSWPTAISSPQEVKLIPFINVFDEDIYIPLSSFDDPGDPSGVEF